MRPTTRLARLEKINNRRAVKEINNPGKRLIWIRVKLNLTQAEIAKETSIPYSSYSDRESGIRSDFYEEQLVIAAYLDRKWQAKYGKLRYPEYEGQQVKSITPMWLMFGSDDVEKNHELVKARLMEKIAEMKADHERKQEELNRQLELFKDIG